MLDAQLLQSCIEKDRKAQYQLYKRYYGLLMGVCIRYKKNEEEAKAALNLGFLKIFNNLQKYPTHIPFEAWARRIMINTLIDEFRKERKLKATIEYSNFERVELYDNYVDLNEADLQFDAEEIDNLIKQLPPTSQKAFNLFAIDGYSHKEIAQLLNISVNASKWHVSNARKILKQKMMSQLGYKMKKTA